MNSSKIMNSYMNSWKNIWFLVYQEVSFQRISIYEFIYGFIFTHVNSLAYMWMWIHIWIHIWKHFLWIHIWTHILINIIWRSECSKYGEQSVPDPNYDVNFGFDAAAAASHWVSEEGCCERRLAADSIHRSERGSCKWLGHVDWGWLLQTTAGSCKWLQWLPAAVGGGQQRVKFLARSFKF